jgi:hypothetical protein
LCALVGRVFDAQVVVCGAVKTAGWRLLDFRSLQDFGSLKRRLLAHAVKATVDAGGSLPTVPEERVYEVEAELGRRLGIAE